MLKWLQIAKLLAPMLLAQTKIPKELIPVITDGIVVAEETLGAKTGAEKLAKVIEGVGVAIAGINAVKGQKEPDPETVEAEVRKGVSAVVATVNLFKDLSPDPTPSAP